MTDKQKLDHACSVFSLLVEIDKRSKVLDSLLDECMLKSDYQPFVVSLEDSLAELGFTFCIDFTDSPQYQLRDSSNKVVLRVWRAL